MQRDLAEIRKNVKCLHDSMELFVKDFDSEYKPFLKAAIADHVYWTKLKSDVVTHTAKGLIWAAIVGFLAMLWFSMKEYALDLIGHAVTKKP